ncbi:MAG: PDZ domain-containing protein [Rhodospirillales bacterium]|nr:PDZ domain-containing protein [Rhodospirillales bacterium]
MEVQGISKEAAAVLGREMAGVLVKDVAIGEPGAIAGFRRGDLIIKFGAKRISRFEDLLKAVAKTKPGDSVSVGIIRDGENRTLSMRLGVRPPAWQIKEGLFKNFPKIGFTVSAITAKVRRKFLIPWGSVGLVVTLVDKAGLAASGLSPGEIIVQANLKDVWLPNQLSRQIELARDKGQPGVLILIESAGGFRYSVLPVK